MGQQHGNLKENQKYVSFEPNNVLFLLLHSVFLACAQCKHYLKCSNEMHLCLANAM